MPHTNEQQPLDFIAANEYKKFRQSTRYQYDPGVFVLALASRTPKTITVRAHAGFGTRIVDFEAAKSGAPPVLPTPTDTDRDVLVSAVVNIPLPAVSAHEGTYDWFVGGQYVFVTKGQEDVVDSEGEVIKTINGPRVPGIDILNAGSYPFKPSIQTAAALAIAPDGDVRPEANRLLQFPQNIADNSYLWPFTVLPPAFFNHDLLRDDYAGVNDPPPEEVEP